MWWPCVGGEGGHSEFLWSGLNLLASSPLWAVNILLFMFSPLGGTTLWPDWAGIRRLPFPTGRLWPAGAGHFLAPDQLVSDEPQQVRPYLVSMGLENGALSRIYFQTVLFDLTLLKSEGMSIYFRKIAENLEENLIGLRVPHDWVPRSV